MNSKLVFAVFLAYFALVCDAGKAFGGIGGPGGFGGGPNLMLIKQLRFQVKTAENEANLTVTTTNTTIQNNIAATQTSIEQELQASTNRIEAAGANKLQCVNQHKASLAQVNSAAVANCDQAVQFQVMQTQLAQFKTIHAQIGPIYATCGGWFTLDPATCIQTFSEDITTKTTDLKNDIVEAATQAQSDSEKCTADAALQAHDVIAQADKAFEQCVIA